MINEEISCHISGVLSSEIFRLLDAVPHDVFPVNLVVYVLVDFSNYGNILPA